MRLSIWNWVHLISPYIFAILFSEENFLRGLAISLLLVFVISMAPHMDSEVKTGRSFKSKYGKFDEYTTKRGERIGDAKTYINLLHFVMFIVVIIVGISRSNPSNASIHDKKEDTLSNVMSEYKEENYSNTNIPEYYEENSTNIDTTQNNEEIDTTTNSAEKNEEIDINSSAESTNENEGQFTVKVSKSFLFLTPSFDRKTSLFLTFGKTKNYYAIKDGFLFTRFNDLAGDEYSGWILISDVNINN